MKEHAPFLPGLSPVGGKPVHVTFDGGRLTSGRRGAAAGRDRAPARPGRTVGALIEDPRAPERVRHGLAEMIRFRALLIAAGYADANDCDALRTDPAFKMGFAGCPRPGPSCARSPPCAGWRTCPRRVQISLSGEGCPRPRPRVDSAQAESALEPLFSAIPKITDDYELEAAGVAVQVSARSSLRNSFRLLSTP